MRSPKTVTVSHKKRLYVTVSEATVQIGIRRQQLALDARQNPPANIDHQLLRLLVYPDLIAAVVDNHGFDHWPITFDEYLELPEQFAYEWEQAVYRLNPHWIVRDRQPKQTDDLYQRLTQLINDRKQESDLAPELPEDVPLADYEQSYRIWLLMEATGWRFLPSQLMAEPEWLLNDLLTIASTHGKIDKMVNRK